MAPPEIHEPERLIRYAEGVLSPEARLIVDQHLVTCIECQEFLSFVQEFTATLREARPHEHTPDEACPESSLIIALQANELDSESAQQTRAHLLMCEECLKEFFLLQRIAQESAMGSRWWQQIDALRESLLDLGKTYGIGSVLGAFRIIAEGPLLAMRGGPALHKSLKQLQVDLNDNTYSIEFSVSTTGVVTCDVAGIRILNKKPIGVEVRAESGKELASIRTDQYGNGRITIPADINSSDLLLLTMTSDGPAHQLLFRVAQTR